MVGVMISGSLFSAGLFGTADIGVRSLAAAAFPDLVDHWEEQVGFDLGVGGHVLPWLGPAGSASDRFLGVLVDAGTRRILVHRILQRRRAALRSWRSLVSDEMGSVSAISFDDSVLCNDEIPQRLDGFGLA
jgi:hypothetical protein